MLIGSADITTYSIIPFIIFGTMSFYLWLWFSMLDLLKHARTRLVRSARKVGGLVRSNGKSSKIEWKTFGQEYDSSLLQCISSSSKLHCIVIYLENLDIRICDFKAASSSATFYSPFSNATTPRPSPNSFFISSPTNRENKEENGFNNRDRRNKKQVNFRAPLENFDLSVWALTEY